MTNERIKIFLISDVNCGVGQFGEENGRPRASQMKLNVPAALVELLSDRSNICFNATSGLNAREKSTIAVTTALCDIQRKGTVLHIADRPQGSGYSHERSM